MNRVSRSKTNKKTIETSINNKEIEKLEQSENDDSSGLAWPSVVCVVVSNDPGEWFENSIKSIVNSGYPDLTTLILDLSENEDLKDRVANIAPSAFIRKFDHNYNFASAINDAVNSIEGATYVLICHDDVVLRKGAIDSMAQEAFRSNASMVGPKILDGDNPDCLLEVGGMIDRFGVPFSGIEHDEVDQSQHDGVRDVFYVSSATMLVRADLFRALGGFDELCFPGAEDIDLSWRAHLVGARVLVQPDAAVIHHHISESVNTSRESTRSIVAKHRMRAVLKNSSGFSLAWLLPISFILHSIEGIFFLLKFDPKRSVLLFRGWLWNIKHIKDLRKLRKEIQGTRVVTDRDISSHQIAGSARIRRFFNSISRSRQLKQFRSLSVESIKNSKKTATGLGSIYFGAFLFYFLSLRNLLAGQVQSYGSFVKWQSFSDQFNSLMHGGYPTTSSPSFASTTQRIISLFFTTVFGFNEGFAQRAFIFSLIPIGVYGVHHLLKSYDITIRAVIVGSLTYGLVLMGYGLFEDGKFSALVMACALPYFIDGLLRNRYRRVGLSAALIVAYNPAAFIILSITCIAYLILSYKSSKFSKNIKTISYGALIACLINVGFIHDSIFRIDRSSLGMTAISDSYNDFFLSSNFPQLILYIAIFISIVSLVIVKSNKTLVLKVLTLSTSILCALCMIAIKFDSSTIDFSNIFIVGCLALALASAFCIDAYSYELTKKSFGIYHLANVLATLGLFAIIVIQIPVFINGSLNLSESNWSSQIISKFDSRVAYVGSTKYLSSNAALLPGNRGLLISSTPEITTSNSVVGPSNKLDDDFRKIYSVILKNETSHAGYLFSKMGIGTIVVPAALTPDSDTGVNDQELLSSLDRQVDLIRLQDRKGLVVYKNQVLTSDFKYNQISSPINIDNLLLDDTSTDTNKKSFSNIGIVNLLVVIGSIFSILIVFVWHRRNEIMTNAYLSVNKMQSNKDTDDIDLTTKKKVERINSISIVEDELSILSDEQSPKSELKK